MIKVPDKLKGFFEDRWLVFVASMWVQSCAGIGYLFGSISPVIKSAMGYNQRQVALLGVAKDLGDAIGFVPGILCEILPIWMVLFIGVLQNFIGYSLVGLIVVGALRSLPLWLVSHCISLPSLSLSLFWSDHLSDLGLDFCGRMELNLVFFFFQ